VILPAMTVLVGHWARSGGGIGQAIMTLSDERAEKLTAALAVIEDYLLEE